MNRKPCAVCGSIDGPSIYASDETCSVFCQKVLNNEMTVEDWEKRTGRRAIYER